MNLHHEKKISNFKIPGHINETTNSNWNEEDEIYEVRVE
jgi:hypothetical protein